MKRIALLLLGGILLTSCQENTGGDKVAIVDNPTIRENYKALSDVNRKYEANINQLEERAEREGREFNEKVQNFQNNFKSMTEAKAAELQKELIEEQQRLQASYEALEIEMRKKLSKSHDSLENVLQDKVKEIAKSKGYTVVLGANENLNVLFAQDNKDITQEVLDVLNK